MWFTLIDHNKVEFFMNLIITMTKDTVTRGQFGSKDIQYKQFSESEPDHSGPKLALLMIDILQYLLLTKVCPANSKNR